MVTCDLVHKNILVEHAYPAGGNNRGNNCYTSKQFNSKAWKSQGKYLHVLQFVAILQRKSYRLCIYCTDLYNYIV